MASYDLCFQRRHERKVRLIAHRIVRKVRSLRKAMNRPQRCNRWSRKRSIQTKQEMAKERRPQIRSADRVVVFKAADPVKVIIGL